MPQSAVREESGVVAVVAEIVEGFTGVFDRYLGTGGRGEEGIRHGGVEMRAVRVVLV